MGMEHENIERIIQRIRMAMCHVSGPDLDATLDGLAREYGKELVYLAYRAAKILNTEWK